MFKDKNERNEYYRKKYAENPEPFLEKSKRWEEKNKEHRLNYYKEYRENNKEKRSEQFKKWYEENKEKVAERKRKYRKERGNELEKERMKNDPSFKLKKNCRRRILHALNGTTKKSAKTEELIGCSFQQLREHLESQFTEGMTWENQGEWHVDHIKPCISFDLIDPEQQKECFNYKNLQPLWAYDNMSKGGKV